LHTANTKAPDVALLVSATLVSPMIFPPVPVPSKHTRPQIIGFWAAWSGWTLDGMDSFIYALVLLCYKVDTCCQETEVLRNSPC